MIGEGAEEDESPMVHLEQDLKEAVVLNAMQTTACDQ